MDFLPQVGSKYLDQRNFKSGNFSVHKDTGKIQLNLETNINVGSIDGRRPPECESSVGNLVKTTLLGVGQFFVFHGVFESTGFFPK